MFRPSRHRSFLQGCAFALLLFGLACKPVLGFVGELHAVEHAALAGHADDHGNDHGDDGEDPGHALGAHGLLHQCGSSAGWIPALHPMLVLAPMPAMIPPAIQPAPPARHGLTLPFRPPIA